MLDNFIQDENGITGAEVALITMLALGVIILVVNFIRAGAQRAAQNAQRTLQNAR